MLQEYIIKDFFISFMHKIWIKNLIVNENFSKNKKIYKKNNYKNYII